MSMRNLILDAGLLSAAASAQSLPPKATPDSYVSDFNNDRICVYDPGGAVRASHAGHVKARSATNLPLEDVADGKAMLAFEVDGQPLDEDHGWPARLVVPHLYFWKSAKWIRGLRFLDEDEPGFWETHGYHMRGDPWHEQRNHGE